MRRAILIAIAALALSGCWLDSLWSDHDDHDDQPATTQQMWDTVEPAKK